MSDSADRSSPSDATDPLVDPNDLASRPPDDAAATTSAVDVGDVGPSTRSAESASPAESSAPVKGERSLPSALPRVVVVLLGLAAAVIAGAGIKVLGDVIGPTFLALTLVISVHPLQTWLVAKRVPKAVAAAICLLIVYVIVIGLLGALVLTTAQLVLLLPNYQRQFVALYQGIIDRLSSFGIAEDQLNTAFSNLDPNSAIPAIQGLLSPVLNGTSIGVFLITVLVFLAMDSMDFSARLRKAAVLRPTFVSALDNFATGVRRYWVVSAVFGLIVAVVDVVGLLVIGVPLALMWGLLSFITNFIPNIGFVLGLIPPALLALLAGGPEHGVRDMLIVVIFYSVANLLIQVVIQPRFTGDAVGVTTTISFLSLAVWAIILGPLGALLALPATLFVKSMLVDADPRSRWLNTLISSKG